MGPIHNPILTNILSIFRHPQQQHHQHQQQYDKYGLINNPAYAIDNALKKNSAPLPAIMAPNTGAVQVIWVVEFSREGYKIRLIFGQNSAYSNKSLNFVTTRSFWQIIEKWA